MALSNIFKDNKFDIFSRSLTTNIIDNTGELDIGLTNATTIKIGSASSPVYIGGSLYNPTVGDGYIANSIVTATDSNGIIVDNVGGQLRMEIADYTHPGIVTNVFQTFGGNKNFPDGLLTPVIDSIDQLKNRQVAKAPRPGCGFCTVQ